MAVQSKNAKRREKETQKDRRMLHQWHSNRMLDEIERRVEESEGAYRNSSHFVEQAVRWFFKFLDETAVKDNRDVKRFVGSEEDYGLKRRG